MARGNPENLRAAAQRKHHAAIARATDRARRARSRRQAGHLPRPGEGRGRVDRLPIPLAVARADRAAARRARQRPARAALRPRSARPPTQSNVVRALTAQIAELKQRHRAETEQPAGCARRRARREPRAAPPARPPEPDVGRLSAGRRKPPNATEPASQKQRLELAPQLAKSGPASSDPKAAPRDHRSTRHARTRSNTSRAPAPRYTCKLGVPVIVKQAAQLARPSDSQAQSAARNTPAAAPTATDPKKDPLDPTNR